MRYALTESPVLTCQFKKSIYNYHIDIVLRIYGSIIEKLLDYSLGNNCMPNSSIYEFMNNVYLEIW